MVRKKKSVKRKKRFSHCSKYIVHLMWFNFNLKCPHVYSRGKDIINELDSFSEKIFKITPI